METEKRSNCLVGRRAWIDVSPKATLDYQLLEFVGHLAPGPGEGTRFGKLRSAYEDALDMFSLHVLKHSLVVLEPQDEVLVEESYQKDHLNICSGFSWLGDLLFESDLVHSVAHVVHVVPIPVTYRVWQ